MDEYQILMDRPMNDGKHVWSIKIDQLDREDHRLYLGVSARPNNHDFESYLMYWDFAYYVYKSVGDKKNHQMGMADKYGTFYREGDVI